MGLNKYFGKKPPLQDSENDDFLEINYFLVMIIPDQKQIPKEGLKEIEGTIDQWKENFPDAFEWSGDGNSPIILKNNGYGLIVLQKLYQKFYPLCFVKACYEFNPWDLPKDIKEYGKWQIMEKKEINKVKYRQKLSNL